jgi:hypothetical protein
MRRNNGTKRINGVDTVIMRRNNGTPYHPACPEVFTDAGSVGHVLIGGFAAGLPAAEALAVFSLFAGYQISQVDSGESWSRVGGELLEFGLGMLIANLAPRE